MAMYLPVTPDVKSLADKLIALNHPHLKLVSINYLFRPEALLRDDKAVAGMAIKNPDRDWMAHHHDFTIELAHDLWTSPETTDEFREALLDHELSHCSVVMENGVPEVDDKGRIKVRMRSHDIEEFEGVLARHGAYHKNLRDFLQAFAKGVEERKKNKGKPVAQAPSAALDTSGDVAM